MRTDSREMLAVGMCGGRSRIGDRIETLLRRGRAFSTRISTKGLTAGAVVLSALMIASSLTPRWIAFAEAAPQRPTYEVVSIKRNRSGDQGDMHTGPPDAANFKARNMTLRMLLKIAYRVKDSQIVGGPAWTRSERYDVDAKPPEATTSAERSTLMLRSLLEDRFHLALRHETRSIPVYALKGAFRLLKTNPVRCVEFGPNSPPVPHSPSEPPPTPCGGFISGPNLIEGGNISMGEFADVLGNFLDRPVVDRTGFTGRFTVRLDFSAEGTVIPGETDSSLPSIFTAVEEQLGLKLEAQKSPADVLFIDRVEKPDAN